MTHWLYQGSGLWLCIETCPDAPGVTEIGRIEGMFHESGQPYYCPVRGLGRNQERPQGQFLTLEEAKAWVEAHKENIKLVTKETNI